MTVVLVLITGHIIWYGKDREVESLDIFFRNIPQKDLLDIKETTMAVGSIY